MGLSESKTDEEVGQTFIDTYIFIHTKNNMEKLNTLLIMIEKLYAAVSNECQLDNLDSNANHEIMLGGHLYM